jgi:hypothetical protein
VQCNAARCGAVRCGAVRCNAVRRGAVRCGAVRCGAVRHGAVRRGAVRCGAVRCGTVRCGAVRCGAVRCGAVRCSAVRCGAVRRSAAQHTRHDALRATQEILRGCSTHVPPVWLPFVHPWHVNVLGRIVRHDGALHLDEGWSGCALGLELGGSAVVDLGMGGEVRGVAGKLGLGGWGEGLGLGG